MKLIERALARTSALTMVVLWATVPAWPATTRHVWPDSPAPAPPYADWTTAAHVIQDAVDAAEASDLVLVTNGVYATGGQAVAPATLTNRVAVTKPLQLASVNGPQATIIQGAKAPGGGNGQGAVRCAYLADGVTLSGFTLSNGATRYWGSDWEREQVGGGAWCASMNAVLTNCVLTGNSAQYYGGGAYRGALKNCTLSGNSAESGGGAYGSTLANCTLTGNSALPIYEEICPPGGGCILIPVRGGTGGGAANCTLSGSTLANHLALEGGGAYYSTLTNCILEGNSAGSRGGGASRGTLNNCTLTGNSASQVGGGAFDSTLRNCALMGNSTGREGGGVFGGTLNNCTLTGNSATGVYAKGGGAYGGTLNNCLVYFNTAPIGADYSGSTFTYSCTTPLPPGSGNIDADPLLASLTHLSAQSPCIGRGDSAYASGVDMDGEPWLNPPCVGADQFVAGTATGPVTVALTASYPKVATGFAVSFVGQFHGHLATSAWDFGDGVVVSNRPHASHSWARPGLYSVRLTGCNDSHPDGVSATLVVEVTAREVYYVNGTNARPVPPYTDRAGAAVTIQEAIDAGTQIGRLVLVGDGVYASGGRAVVGTLTNRVVITEGVEVRSENGPLVTVITGQPSLTPDERGNGDGAIRCVYVGTNAVLSGFTLTNGHTRTAGVWLKEQRGGGAWCEFPSAVLTNCVLTGNTAEIGGGAHGGTLDNCTLGANSAGIGGGAVRGTLNDCNLTSNSAGEGGGAYAATLNTCTLKDNSAAFSGGGAYEATLSTCILTANSAEQYGGGVAHGTLNNCTLTGNKAEYGGGASESTLDTCVLTGNAAGSGGGAAFGTLSNCILTGNAAVQYGGGASKGTLNNCTLTGNSAKESGGGVAGSTLNNCLVYFNTAPNGPNWSADDQASLPGFAFACTTPLPPGPGNIALDPLFINAAGGDFRLRPDSPCINAGSNEFVFGETDVAGNPRIISGTVDIGAYESQGSGSVISYAWLQSYGLPTDGAADFADPDTDGLNTWQEWRCQTDPSNVLSVLRLLSATPAETGMTVSWPGVEGVTYFLERSLDLGASPPFSPLATNLSGPSGTHTFTDTNAAASPRGFYRVGVGP